MRALSVPSAGVCGLALSVLLGLVACGGDGSSGSGGAASDEGGGGGTGAEGGGGGNPDGGAGGGDTDGSMTVPAGTCGTANPPMGFIAKTTIKVGAASRTYALTIPAGYNGTKLYPLVIGFHGDGGTGAQYRSSLAIEAAAGGNAIFAWPDGTNNNNGHSFDQAHDPPMNADVDLFDALVKQVSTTYCVNGKKVFIHGMSGGAYFANQLGRWRASAIAAVAPQSGGGPFGISGADYDKTGNLTITNPVPAFIIHGDADNSVPMTEGQKSLAFWEYANMASTTMSAPGGPSPCVKQSGGKAAVYWCKIPGMGHTIWSGAAAGIWAFFSAI